MAAAQTAKLLASLDLDSKGFTRGVDQAMGGLGKLESRIGKIGGLAAQGARNAATNIARISVVAGAGITLAVKGGLEDLAELENAVTSVDGAIAQMGLTGQVTGAQVASWANDIERDIGAAFDDKAITQAATTLIRFGGVTTSNLRPALAVIADLATKTGDVDSAATLLAKALADPTKAAGKLSRVGIILTKVQQDQIKALVKAGDTAKAQAVILDALAKSTEGAAEASQGPYKRALSVLADVTEDARKALAVGFLPVIEKVAGILSTELAKPQTLANIKEFGQSLATGLDKLIDIAKNLPWAQIGDSLKIAGAGAKVVLEAFTKLPPWVQTAVLTGWGLNKLTGGALGGIVAELGKGLIKGVLGMTAGVVNINAATVNGVGGVGGGKPGGGGILGVLGAVTIAGFAIGAAEALGTAIINATGGPTGGGGRQFGPIIVGQSQAAAAHGQVPIQELTAAQKEANRILSEISTHTQRDGEIGRDQKAKIDATNALLEKNRLAIADTLSATRTGTSAMERAAAALEKKQQQAVNITVNAQFTVRDITRKNAISSRLGFVAS